jgi:DNA-binding transcriptional MerR regulator
MQDFRWTKQDKVGPEEVLQDDQAELSPRQITALEVRIVGGSQAEAAKQAGVDERTVRRWESHNYAFISEWNHRLHQRNMESAERVSKLWDLATANMLTALREGDREVTLTVFKAMVKQPPQYPVNELTGEEVRQQKVRELATKIHEDLVDSLEQTSLLADLAAEISDYRNELTTDHT